MIRDRENKERDPTENYRQQKTHLLGVSGQRGINAANIKLYGNYNIKTGITQRKVNKYPKINYLKITWFRGVHNERIQAYR